MRVGAAAVAADGAMDMMMGEILIIYIYIYMRQNKNERRRAESTVINLSTR